MTEALEKYFDSFANLCEDWTVESSLGWEDYGSEHLSYPRHKESLCHVKTGRPQHRRNKHLDWKEVVASFYGTGRTRKQRFLLATYPKRIPFILIDIDNHLIDPARTTPSQRSAVQRTRSGHYFCPEEDGYFLDDDVFARKVAEFQTRIDRVRSMITSLGLDQAVIWTTSPGDWVNGGIRHGLYAWIILDCAETVETVTALASGIRERFGLKDIEFRTGGPGALIRLAGQRGLFVCDPGTQEPIKPGDDDISPRDDETHPIHTFLAHLASVKRTSVQAIERALGDVVLDKPATATVEKIDKAKRYTYRAAEFPVASVEQAREEPNTFKRIVQHRKTPSRLIWLEKRGQITRTEAIDRFCEDLILSAPRNPDGSIGSTTASDPKLRTALATRVLAHFDRSFDPKMRASHRDELDRQRFWKHEQFISFNQEHGNVLMRAVSRLVSLSYHEKEMLEYLLDKMARYKGRVASEITYRGKNAPFDWREWLPFWKKIRGAVIEIIDDSDKNTRKCRQYGFAKTLVAKVISILRARERNQSILNKSVPDPHFPKEVEPQPVTQPSALLDASVYAETNRIVSMVMDTCFQDFRDSGHQSAVEILRP